MDASTLVGSTLYTSMAALAPMELEIKREPAVELVAKRRKAAKNLDGRKQSITASRIRIAFRFWKAARRQRKWPGTSGCHELRITPPIGSVD